MRVHSVFKQEHAALSYRPPAYLRILKAGMTVFVTVAVIVILYVLIWFVMASQLRQGVEEWVEQRRADGQTVRYSRLEMGGFPFLLRAIVEGPAMGMENAAAPWAWEGSRAVVSMRPWNPWRVEVDLAGTHKVGLGGGATYDGAAGELTVDLALGGDWPERIGLTVRALAFARSGGATALKIGRATVEARHHDFPDDEPPDHQTRVLEVSLKSQGLRVPSELGLPLGRNISALNLEAALLGATPPGTLLESLAKWRDGGGTVEVGHLSLDYGPLVLRGNGTLALDAAMQPIGSFTAKIQGFFETINVLRRKGLVRSRDAVTAKLVLGILAKKPPGGGPATFSLPLTLQNQTLYAGPVSIATVPPIEWSGPVPPPPDR
jgi:hypothetical protein